AVADAAMIEMPLIFREIECFWNCVIPGPPDGGSMGVNRGPGRGHLQSSWGALGLLRHGWPFRMPDLSITGSAKRSGSERWRAAQKGPGRGESAACATLSDRGAGTLRRPRRFEPARWPDGRRRPCWDGTGSW